MIRNTLFDLCVGVATPGQRRRDRHLIVNITIRTTTTVVRTLYSGAVNGNRRVVVWWLRERPEGVLPSSVARWLQRSLGGSQLMNSGTCDMTAMAVSELTGWDAFAAACDGDRKQGLERADLRTKTAPEKGAFRGTTNVRHQRF